jgi:hypothetical protein
MTPNCAVLNAGPDPDRTSPADGRFGLFEFKKSSSEEIRLHATATWPTTETEKGA